MIALFVDLKATFDTANRQIDRNKKRIVCGRGKNLRKNSRLVEKLNRNAHSIRFCTYNNSRFRWEIRKR